MSVYESSTLASASTVAAVSLVLLITQGALNADDTGEGRSETKAPFALKPTVDLERLSMSATHDLNLGESPSIFIKALWKQFTGRIPEQDLVREYSSQMRSGTFRRRIDLGIALAEKAGVKPRWQYSDPWQIQTVLEPNTTKKLARDVGAVFMFFFTSPEGPNGGPGWANNHVPGMTAPASIYRSDSTHKNLSKDGLYHPDNAGFWYREFRDSRHAGLNFLLLNVYGPDLQPSTISALQSGLARLREDDGKNVVKLGLFDDTWTWGQPWFGEFWKQTPDCLKVKETSKILYEAKWKPFFEALPRDHWYLINGRPMIYFYNSNTLQNRQNFDRVLPAMKELFRNDFGVTPWVAVDTAFNYRPSMKHVSDSHFKWYTFDREENYASETRGGITLSHSMVRWDGVNRGNGRKERAATADDLIAKDDRILKQVLNDTRQSDILVLATWNDLGEGTGLNRSYDYYWNGEWKQPNHFMNLIRRSQSGELLQTP
ncbi:MAG: DUF5010 domain-containing protein [Roseibacillus sp.]|nr:DUF5010 domain-containing protein [Roseibacillus sp.]